MTSTVHAPSRRRRPTRFGMSISAWGFSFRPVARKSGKRRSISSKMAGVKPQKFMDTVQSSGRGMSVSPPSRLSAGPSGVRPT